MVEAPHSHGNAIIACRLVSSLQSCCDRVRDRVLARLLVFVHRVYHIDLVRCQMGVRDVLSDGGRQRHALLQAGEHGVRRKVWYRVSMKIQL